MIKGLESLQEMTTRIQIIQLNTENCKKDG